MIVVDMQNDFAAVGGMSERANIDVGCIQAIVPRTAEVLRLARSIGMPVVYLKMVFQADLSDTGGPGSPIWLKHLPLQAGASVTAPDGNANRGLIRSCRRGAVTWGDARRGRWSHAEYNHGRSPSNDRTPWNLAERHGDDRPITIYRRYAHLRDRLLPYLAEIANGDTPCVCGASGCLEAVIADPALEARFAPGGSGPSPPDGSAQRCAWRANSQV